MRTLIAMIALSAASLPAWGQDAQALLKKHNCTVCHTIDKALVGPAYKAVAQKYAGQKDAEPRLLEKVKKGGSGVWGQVPMPPNPQVPDADIHTMLKYILTLK
jgi:cytochrome c